MREIKFRMVTQTTGKLLGYVDIYGLLRNGSDVLPDFEEAILDGVKFEQYTGLKDKNGREIYDGDIVEYVTFYYGNEKRHRKVIEWEEWDSDDFGEPHNLGYFNLSEGVEVIGNIHENKELWR